MSIGSILCQHAWECPFTPAFVSDSPERYARPAEKSSPMRIAPPSLSGRCGFRPTSRKRGPTPFAKSREYGTLEVLTLYRSVYDDDRVPPSILLWKDFRRRNAGVIVRCLQRSRVSSSSHLGTRLETLRRAGRCFCREARRRPFCFSGGSSARRIFATVSAPVAAVRRTVSRRGGPGARGTPCVAGLPRP